MFQFQRLRPHVQSVMWSEHDHLEICVVVYSVILPVCEQTLIYIIILDVTVFFTIYM